MHRRSDRCVMHCMLMEGEMAVQRQACAKGTHKGEAVKQDEGNMAYARINRQKGKARTAMRACGMEELANSMVV